MAELERFKLSNLTWDGDADEDGFFVFLENFGNIARSTPSGPLLENMLDSKFCRARVARGTIPSYIHVLEDPDFAVNTAQAQASNSTGPPDPEAEAAAGEVGDDISAASEQHSLAYSGGGTFILVTHHTAYADLPKAAKTLDALL